jgi:hypothetical protein
MTILITYALILLAAGSRLIPHLANLAPITALAIFAGAYLPRKQAIAIPLLARVTSDLIIGFYAWPVMLAVYGAHLFGVLLGFWIKKSKTDTSRWLKISSSGFISAAIFFLVTNFAFLYGSAYPHNLTGIIQSYVNAIPFLRGTLLGDVGYTASLFLAAELATVLAARRQTV